MSTPILTVSALAAVTLFMVVSLVNANGTSNTLQHQLSAVEAASSHNG